MTTTVVRFQSHRRQSFMARALLDFFSNVNLMTPSFASHLQSTAHRCFVNIGAVDNACTVWDEFVAATFYSTYNSIKYSMNFLIVLKIADKVLNETFPRENFDIDQSYKKHPLVGWLPEVRCQMGSPTRFLVMRWNWINFWQEIGYEWNEQ